MLLVAIVAFRLAVDRAGDGGEGNVGLAGPALGAKQYLGTADLAEAAIRLRRRFVVDDMLGAAFDLHLLRLEADPGHEARAVRAPAALAMTMRAEARRKVRDKAYA